ncbi:MAG: B12-binding domain-containing radical SAM protein [Planctomycetota bacterium JB042]
MDVALVFPPAVSLPNRLYHALPLLAGALHRAGHRARALDLNLLAADLLLTDARTDRYLRLAHHHADSSSPEARRTLDAREAGLRRGPASKETLRDPVRFFEPATFRDAFWNVVDALAFFGQLDPIVSPHRETFAADLGRFAEEDPWTVHRDLREEALLDAVLAGAPGLVGITLAFPEQAAETVRLAKRLRERAPDVHLALGGPLVTQFADKWLEDGFAFRFVDSVCVGDGGETIVRLAEALAGNGALEEVPNLARPDGRGGVRRPGTVLLDDLDALPSPDFGAADLSLEFAPQPIFPAMTARGCYWGRCTFCSIGWRENYRLASEETIRRDLVDLARTHGARYVQLQDSSLPPRSAPVVARVVEEEGLDLHWVAGMKFERALLDPAYCEALARGGCRSLMLGFESATQRLVDRMDKGFRVEDVPRMLDNLRGAGISAELLWFVGFPSETRREALHTARTLAGLRERFGLAAFVSEYQLHPDTIVFDRPRDFGLEVTGEENGVCSYVAEAGMQIEDVLEVKEMLADSNNRTLVCNGSHLPHLVETGLDLSGLARPLVVSERLVEACERD